MLIKDKDVNRIEIIYNSNYGLIINEELLDYTLTNTTKVALIINSNDTFYQFYFAIDGLSFTDIIYYTSFPKKNSQLKITFDSQYSDSLELSNIRLNLNLSNHIKEQLDFYKRAPNSYKNIYTEHYSNGSICDINNKTREITVNYFCDYTNNQEFQILELNEPDWCIYQAKIATKYMCGRAHFRESFRHD